LATDPIRATELAAAEVLMRVKFASTASIASWRQIRRMADSLLRSPPTSSEHATALAPLATLLGQCATAEALSRRATKDASPPMSQGLIESADLHLTQSATGCAVGSTVPNLRDLVALADEESRDAGVGVRTFVAAMILRRPTLLKWPLDSAIVDQVAALSTDQPLFLAARGLTRGETDSARAAMSALNAQYAEELGVSPDVAFPAAQLYLALGDTASAITIVDQALNGLRGLVPGSLNEPAITGTLVRVMTLRADLAHARRDEVNARRWGGIVAALWAGSDAELQPVVRRMSAYAGSR
jgi:hypothetical protein